MRIFRFRDGESYMTREHTHSPGMARTFYGLAVMVLIGLIAWVGRGVLIPLVIAIFLGFLIFTLKETVRQTPLIGKHLPNWLGFMLAFVCIGAGAMVFVNIVKSNVATLITEWPAYEARFEMVLESTIAWFENLDFLPQEFVGGFDDLRESALGLAPRLLQQIASSIGAVTSNFLTFITILLYLIFMLIERGRIFRKISLLGSDSDQRHAIMETISDIGVMVRQYLAVKTLSNLVTATISYAIMIIIGVQFAGFWALLIFTLNYIPVFGAASAIVLPVILALVQPDGGPRMALTTLAFLIGAEQVMSNGIEPRLVGRSLNLSPLIVLFSLTIWGSLWGFAGLLLSVPITVTVMIVLSQFETTRPIAIMISDDGRIAELKRPSTSPMPSL